MHIVSGDHTVRCHLYKIFTDYFHTVLYVAMSVCVRREWGTWELAFLVSSKDDDSILA